MQVVSPKSWLVLSTFVGLVVVALLWSIFGRLPTMVIGRGVLIRPRQVVDFQVPAAGRIAALSVEGGDEIKQGHILGTIEQAEIRQQLEEEQAKLQALLSQDETKSALQTQQVQLQIEQIELQQKTIELQRQDLHKRLRDSRSKIPLLRERVQSHKRLEQLGLLPENSTERLRVEQAYLENQDTIAELTAQLQQLEGELKRLESQAKTIAFQNLEASTSRKNQLQELQSNITVLELQLQQNSQIVSQHDGRILEITAHVGQLVRAGQRLGSIEVEDESSLLTGVVYFPIRVGKKIEPGMSIQIAPDTIERQRFGSMLGKVISVSAFPVTKEGIATLVGNPEVVEQLAAQGPAIEVAAALDQDPETFSGYKWSSSGGPPLKVTTGTTTTNRVAIEYRAPITYLMPFLRELSGIY
jgi:HlyD family secretion protein